MLDERLRAEKGNATTIATDGNGGRKAFYEAAAQRFVGAVLPNQGRSIPAASENRRSGSVSSLKTHSAAEPSNRCHRRSSRLCPRTGHPFGSRPPVSQ
ncbi:hypothetical protein ABIA35_003259 [Catenulispora sp. MAP12-49]